MCNSPSILPSSFPQADNATPFKWVQLSTRARTLRLGMVVPQNECCKHCSALTSAQLLTAESKQTAHEQDSFAPSDGRYPVHGHRTHHTGVTRLRHSRHLTVASVAPHGARLHLRSTSSSGVSKDKLIVQDNHKPVFTNCSKYQPSVPEEKDPGYFVFQVQAYDKDPPESGGKITYTFVTAPNERPKFSIDPNTGNITTKQVFDRDEPYRDKEFYLTVRATDNGRPQLDDVCTIKVVIEDVNDNTPVFDKTIYRESVPQDLKVGREVMRVSATDIDDGNNSIVSYQLIPVSDDSDLEYFRIDENTGVIFLQKAIDKQPNYKFNMRAKATDHGKPPKDFSIDLDIEVVESHKKAPTFDYSGIDSIFVKENHSDFSTPLITIQAKSNIPGDWPIFELMSGPTEQTNKLNTFVLEQHNDTADIKLGKHLDYESTPEFVLTVRIRNKHNLAARKTFNIKVEDVNDIIPVFVDVTTGSVLENEPPGTPVMQVRAIDTDGTTANNQVTYELADNKDLFHIDKHTGNITTLVKFDREERDFYNIKVIATDSAPSSLFNDGVRHNKGEQNFRIEIADKNDNKPEFTKPWYIAEAIAEDANINFQVAEVKALDNDTASPVVYSIIDGNTYDAFLIENTTGKIRVKNKLDYENITEYLLKVRAFDGAYEDFANVTIKIENVNDNPPVFLDYNKEITIREEEIPDEKCITKLSAYDPDIADRTKDQHIVYFVVKHEQKKLLTIDKEGCLSLIKPLDRDPPNGFEKWQVLIAADDEDGGPASHRQTTEVVINLIDINDNAPFLDMKQPVIWPENQQTNTNITLLAAKDYDSDTNGPPFKFMIDINADDEIRTKFAISGNTLLARVPFDREEKKVYYIPVAITDSGTPPMTGTSTLTVVIGDVNDNPMKPGKSSIFVYNYKGEAPDTHIGRVYVDDPDDWDLADKRFRWKNDAHPNFNLDITTGMITMLKGTNNNSFVLEFTVTETSLFFPEHSVDAIVNVTVKEIPEEAVDKSGSIRFAGIKAEEFVAPGPNGGPSKQNLLRRQLATFLNVSEENVDVFTVLHSPHNMNSTQLDVRFSAHGSPYYHPERLNGLAAKNQEKIERELGVSILMVNIDECLQEKVFCGEKSCANFLVKRDEPAAVYTNTSSFVGVHAVIKPFCSCTPTERFVCLNGGTLLGDRCECPEGYEGPSCEIISIGFYGEGWALYPPFAACDDAHLSLDIKPFKENGLVFYIGPVTHNPALNVQDFMSLELKDGYPRLLSDYGSGTVVLEHKAQKLSNEKEHHIDIYWTKTSIEIKVDNCQTSSCLALTAPQRPNEFLNVNGPLQLGGSFIDLVSLSNKMNWKFKPTAEGFFGCIRNVTFTSNGNSMTYNLGMPGDAKNVDPGCSQGLAKAAVSFGIDTNFLVAILVCIAILLILLLAFVVHRRKTDDLSKDNDDIRENIINYEDEGGGEGDMTGYDLNVLRLMYNGQAQDKQPIKDNLQKRGQDQVPDIGGFLDDKKKVCDNDPETNPFDDVRHYAYEGDGNTSGSLSSLASGTDEGDLNFDYLSNFGPRFRKLADMYGEDPSDEEEETFHNHASESWC
ncbi:DE-cadherin [Anabrus simplex]|uniref:DE-cadherin n=1 Tax=Anabrus simplex TaxID=316456 RepID=UPI0035A2F8FD